MIWCGSKDRCHKKMCLLEIGLRAQSTITILGTIVTISGGKGDLYDHLTSTKIFTLITYEIFIQTPKIMKKLATTLICSC